SPLVLCFFCLSFLIHACPLLFVLGGGESRFNVIPDSFAPPPDPIKRLYQLQHGSLQALRRGSRQHTKAPPVIPRQAASHILMGMMPSPS
ncbi:unnamed protein product, partial [Discosporangium mesarthrocarpum]